ncbi:MAG: type II toxin-antitoxin system VapC family toxin [Opitutales bacterium]
MERALILETTFLIDFDRERRTGPTAVFLKEHADFRLFITHTIAGELAAGKSLSAGEKWQAFIAPFHILPFSEEVDWEYGKAYRFLQANGVMIGANDLWIAATALVHDVPLVTRNLDHFRRVPGLNVLPYT